MTLLKSYSIAAIAAVAFSIPALAAPNVPANLGLGLSRLVENYQQGKAPLQLNAAAIRNLQIDTAQRVMVNIHLDGTKPIGEVAAQLRGMGLEISAIDPHWRSGVISARLPLDQAVATATSAGVRSVMLAPRPRRRVGSVTAQSSTVEHADKANHPGSVTPQGLIGRGVTVGIVSDSFDIATGTPRAINGVHSGDLPGSGNPDGYTDPVVILEEGFGSDATDEGRGMAEIVHDIAPAAKIAFATSGDSQAAMADNVRRLRTDPSALCDIIVDDVFFFDEPFFTEGEVGQAVEDVATSNALPGKKVAFFSSAGNAGNFGYSADFRRLTPAQATAAQGPVHLTSVPSSYYSGGVHNFGSASNPVIAMPVTTDPDGAATIVFQWDDPFDAGAVTTDYNLVVFDENGNFLNTITSAENNFATDEPIEMSDLEGDKTYYLMIGLRSSAPPTATHLRLLSIDGAVISSSYVSYDAPTITGHTLAADADAVGAYFYNDGPDRIANYNSAGRTPPPGPYRPVLESFSSVGGQLAIYFDSLGNRFPTPEIRLKPDFSAADGVDTSFFPTDPEADYDNDHFPNFFGTSASAPTAAGIGALMLEAAGGPGHLAQSQMRTKLKLTTFAHDVDPFSCTAMAKSGQAVVTVTGTGNDTNKSAASANFFTVTFTGTSATLNQLQTDLTNPGLVFDNDPDTGTPFVRGSSSPGVMITPSVSANRRVLTLNFGATFHAGQTIRFGIDRDYAGTGFGGNSADFLAGGEIIATFSTGTTLIGGFANRFGHGFTLADGYGLVNAQAAVESIVGKAPVTNGVPRNISTRGFVGTGDDALIGGFIIQDNAKKVVVRALGPSLTSAGVPGVLIDPVLDLYNANGTLLARNDNWRDSPSAASQIQALGLAPANVHESALIRTLPAANYTAIVRGLHNTTGIGLVEIYDVDAAGSTAQLVNVSSRGLVKTGAGGMIGGFIITGARPANVVVRALGPSLASSGISGFLPDPILELHDRNGALILTNDNWQQDSLQATQIFADGLAPTSALESAAAVSLQAGNYTAVVRGARNSTGIGLVEMYNIR